MIKRLQHNERLVWLVKTRKMRDVQLQKFRRYAPDALSIVALSRRLKNVDNKEADYEVDDMATEMLEAALQEDIEALLALQKQLTLA